ncbi:MAG TPA: diaminopimelate decarboxylase [Anaerolineales bacterium]|nr:diaminopimelate decarboxylase [Anaerolineales bacterium]
MLPKPERLQLFPDTTTIQNDSLLIAGQDVAALAQQHGTPLYIYDRQTMDEAARHYKAALKAHYPAASSITYAGKAFLCRAIAEWAGQQGFLLDCTGEGELAIAAAARLAPASILAHGVNKSRLDLAAAMLQAGILVVDNLSELRRLPDLMKEVLTGRGRSLPQVWLRLQPGAAVETHHAHTKTGQIDSKFGMDPGELLEAAELARVAGIPIHGIHFHQGSNFRDTAPLVSAIDLAVRLAKEMRLPDTWHFCPGGGWGAAYHEDELPQPDIDQYVKVIAREVMRRCRAANLPLPTLHLEPGRSLIARAGVAVYRVGAVKQRKNRTWLLVDGGMADNPRFALYGARYSCLPAKGLARTTTDRVSIGGPYCESGDVLIEDLLMPPIEEGELLVVPVSGAYQLSMASNYNGARRPAAIWLERGGRSRLILRRETSEDLSHRQLSIL